MTIKKRKEIKTEKISQQKRVAVITFGCKVNQYESACILNDFQHKGYHVVPFSAEADIYIINTCTVTNRTDYKSRHAIRQALERKAVRPGTKVIVTGCYAQLNREHILSMGDIDLLVDNNHKGEIKSMLQGKESDFIENPESFNTFSEQQTDTLFTRSRAFIKIQDGCDYFCAYCTIPLARGKPRSRRPDNVFSQIDRLLTEGYQEFVLTGINLGLYGRDFRQDPQEQSRAEEINNLASLLFRIENIEGVKLIRLSSLEPQLIDNQILDFIRKSKKLATHLHIPLQSGSDLILRNMNRPYSTGQFRELIEEIISIKPDIALGSDLIVGLPGESEELFQESFTFIEQLPLAYLHIFPYSRRPRTRAADMPGIPTAAITVKRCSITAGLMMEKRKGYREMLINRKAELSGILECERGNYWTALSDHYIRIYYKNRQGSKGDLIKGKASRELFDGIEVVDR